MTCAEPKPSSSPKRGFRIAGIAVVGTAAWVVVGVVFWLFLNALPGLFLIGLIAADSCRAPTQENLMQTVRENVELLDLAVAEAGTLGGDACEISTYANTEGWRRERLGGLRGMYLYRSGETGTNSYEPLKNEVFERVLDLAYVESIDVSDGGFRLDCGATGIVPSGASYAVSYRPGLRARLETGDTTLGPYPCAPQDGGWLVAYGGDNTLLLIPIVDDWFYEKETW